MTQSSFKFTVPDYYFLCALTTSKQLKFHIFLEHSRRQVVSYHDIIFVFVCMQIYYVVESPFSLIQLSLNCSEPPMPRFRLWSLVLKPWCLNWSCKALSAAFCASRSSSAIAGRIPVAICRENRSGLIVEYLALMVYRFCSKDWVVDGEMLNGLNWAAAKIPINNCKKKIIWISLKL